MKVATVRSELDMERERARARERVGRERGSERQMLKRELRKLRDIAQRREEEEEAKQREEKKREVEINTFDLSRTR